MKIEKAILKTRDNVKIAADFYPVKNPLGYFVLSHMMPETKKSWQKLALKAQKAEYVSIAIDLRGHGESDFGPSGFLRFNDKDHQNSILDLESAVEYLKERGAVDDRVYMIGASIGANLSLQYLSEHRAICGAALLSAGLNYRGIEALPLIKKLSQNQKILLVVARDDDDAVDAGLKLHDTIAAGIKKEMIVYEKGGHGTDLFDAQDGPDLAEKILSFVAE